MEPSDAAVLSAYRGNRLLVRWKTIAVIVATVVFGVATVLIRTTDTLWADVPAIVVVYGLVPSLFVAHRRWNADIRVVRQAEWVLRLCDGSASLERRRRVSAAIERLCRRVEIGLPLAFRGRDTATDQWVKGRWVAHADRLRELKRHVLRHGPDDYVVREVGSFAATVARNGWDELLAGPDVPPRRGRLRSLVRPAVWCGLIAASFVGMALVDDSGQRIAISAVVPTAVAALLARPS